MPVLLRLAADGSSRVDTVLELPGLDCVIGRGAEAHVSVIDDSVSREHARIFLAGDRWAVLSLSDSNPIRVAGRAVERLDLDAGTEFTLGRVRFRFEHEDPRAKSTVVVDGADAAATIAQVKAARAAAAAPAAAPAAEGSRNPFLSPQVAPPPTTHGASVPTTNLPVQPAATTSAAPPPAQPPATPRRHESIDDGPGRMERPPSALHRPRMWPKVLLAVVILLGVAAAVFHRPLLELAGFGLAGTNAGDTSATSEGDEGTEQTGGDGAAYPVDDQSGALGGWRRTESLDCAALTEPMPEDSEIGKVVALSGHPTGFMFARESATSTGLVLEYANAGQHVTFEDGKFTGGTEGPREADAKPLGSEIVAGRLAPDTDPRCIVRTLGPAHIMLGGVPLPIEGPTTGVPLGWMLEGGGFMVTVGTELWALRVDGTPVAPPQGTTWAGVVRPKYERDEERPLVLVHEGPGEKRSIELLQVESSEDQPSLIWTHPRREAPMDLVFEPGDEVTTYLAGDETGSDPTYLHAELGLIDLPTPSLQVRPFELTFEYGDAKFDYVGTLVRTPWREE